MYYGSIEHGINRHYYPVVTPVQYRVPTHPHPHACAAYTAMLDMISPRTGEMTTAAACFCCGSETHFNDLARESRVSLAFWGFV